MKQFYIFSFVCLASCLSNQKLIRYNSNEYESLRKYSYMLLGAKKIGDTVRHFPLGTCFFVRKESKLLMITSKHSLSGYSTITKEVLKNNYDSIEVKYIDTNNGQLKTAQFNIKPLKKWFTNTYFFEEGDFNILQIFHDDLDRNVFSIESFLTDTLKSDEKLDSLITIGYGTNSPELVTYETEPLYRIGMYANKDFIHKRYPNFDFINDAISPSSIQGQSGSPIFIRCINKNNTTTHWLFGGLLFAGNEMLNISYLVKPEIINYAVKVYQIK